MNNLSLLKSFDYVKNFSPSEKNTMEKTDEKRSENSSNINLKDVVEYHNSDLTLSGRLKVIITTDNRAVLKKVLENSSTQRNVIIKNELPIINGVAMEIDPESKGFIADLVNMKGSVKVTIDGNMHAIEPVKTSYDNQKGIMEVAGKALGIERMWEKGFKGRDQIIAVIDTGIALHPDLKGNLIAFADILNKKEGIENAYDDQGHGTHCAGIAVGTGKESMGKFAGAAPEAKLVGVKVLNKSGMGSNSEIIAGIQWVIEKKRQGIIDTDIISLSLGGSSKLSYKDDPVMQAVEKAVENGIMVFAAAGNSGEYGPLSIDSPGAAPHVVTVGAIDDKGTIISTDDEMAEFSGIGPTLVDLLPKPDIVTPGVNITSTKGGSGYITHSGTSMATPLAAGMAALLKQAFPEKSPEEIKQVIMKTARALPGVPQDSQGSGVFDLALAYDKLTEKNKTSFG